MVDEGYSTEFATRDGADVDVNTVDRILGCEDLKLDTVLKQGSWVSDIIGVDDAILAGAGVDRAFLSGMRCLTGTLELWYCDEGFATIFGDNGGDSAAIPADGAGLVFNFTACTPDGKAVFFDVFSMPSDVTGANN